MNKFQTLNCTFSNSIQLAVSKYYLTLKLNHWTPTSDRLSAWSNTIGELYTNHYPLDTQLVSEIRPLHVKCGSYACRRNAHARQELV